MYFRLFDELDQYEEGLKDRVAGRVRKQVERLSGSRAGATKDIIATCNDQPWLLGRDASSDFVFHCRKERLALDAYAEKIRVKGFFDGLANKIEIASNEFKIGEKLSNEIAKDLENMLETAGNLKDQTNRLNELK